MAEIPSKRDRRDWTLIIILLPIGILFMVIAGQLAIRLVPSWRVNGGMGSNLDPNSANGQSQGQISPLSLDILTPMSWLESFLTPGPDSGDSGVPFAPFVVFDPSSTPSPSASPTVSDTPATPSTTPRVTTTTTTTSTSTKKPPKDDGTPEPPTTCTDPNALNNGGSLPCNYPVPVTSTLVGSSTSIPGNTNVGTPDGSVGNVQDGKYIVINLSPNPIVVNGISDTGYDLVYSEMRVTPCNPSAPCPSGSGIQMDSVILSISADNTTYYVVFNWGDGVPDTNSNIGDVASSTGTEYDNQSIDSSELAGSGVTQTGVLIDVDNAPSHPPAGNYSYLAIQAPAAPAQEPPQPPGTDGADVDSVEVLP